MKVKGKALKAVSIIVIYILLVITIFNFFMIKKMDTRERYKAFRESQLEWMIPDPGVYEPIMDGADEMIGDAIRRVDAVMGRAYFHPLKTYKEIMEYFAEITEE